MRFKEYLIEAAPFNLENFKKDCAPFLKQLEGTRGTTPLFRGDKQHPQDWSVITWQERSKPRNTPEVAHEMFNHFFKQQFGMSARNWMFATGDDTEARSYGTLAMIFPIGNFQWICSKNPSGADLTLMFNDNVAMVSQSQDGLDDDDVIYQAASDTVDEMKTMGWYHNTNLEDCIMSNNEIMFRCSSYYAINLKGHVYNSLEFQDFWHSL